MREPLEPFYEFNNNSFIFYRNDYSNLWNFIANIDLQGENSRSYMVTLNIETNNGNQLSYVESFFDGRDIVCRDLDVGEFDIDKKKKIFYDTVRELTREENYNYNREEMLNNLEVLLFE